MKSNREDGDVTESELMSHFGEGGQYVSQNEIEIDLSKRQPLLKQNIVNKIVDLWALFDQFCALEKLRSPLLQVARDLNPPSYVTKQAYKSNLYLQMPPLYAEYLSKNF